MVVFVAAYLPIRKYFSQYLNKGCALENYSVQQIFKAIFKVNLNIMLDGLKSRQFGGELIRVRVLLSPSPTGD